MSRFISPCPTMDDSLRSKIGYQAMNYKFYYSKNKEYFDLDSEQVDGMGTREDYIKIADKTCEWDPDTYDLSFNRSISIDIPHFLFGENGIAGEKAELGVGIIWTSKTSNERGVIEMGTFSKSNTSVELSVKKTFFPGTLGSSVNFRTVLYLKKPGDLRPEESHLARTSGRLLGDLDEFTVIIDGNGSLFPIVEVEETNYPLWWVECDWTDPMSDSFSDENIRVCLNRKHKHFESINFLEGIGESPLFLEIISSAIHSMIIKIKETDEWSEISEGRGYESGSIGEAVHYFLSTFGWDTTSPERLALTIRKDLESRF